MRQICVHIHIYDYVVYELPFHPNNAENEVFLYSPEGYLLWEAGMAVTGRIRDIGQNVLQSCFL